MELDDPGTRRIGANDGSPDIDNASRDGADTGPPTMPALHHSILETLRKYEAPHINTASGKTTIVWETAQGATVTDVTGKRYIDLTASFGAAAIGHRHPRVVAAVKTQADKLLLALGDLHGHEPRAQLAERLARFLPLGDAMVYFAMTGSEAVEISIKTAILKTGRSDILVFDPAYHGCTLASLSASSRQSFREPFRDHLSDRMHRLPFGCPPNDIAALLQTGPFAAALVEPIVGREGVLFPPDGWLRGLMNVCHANGALLIVDEILTGFGRTGTWFAFQREGVTPDIVCCGKALGGGIPIAAVVAARDIMMAWDQPGSCIHTNTFLANPISCAAALATLDVMEEENLPDRAEVLGAVIQDFVDALRNDMAGKLAARHATIVDARGRGLLWRIQIEPPTLARSWVEIALSMGVLLLASGGVLRLSPPILIARQQLDDALAILREAFDVALDQMDGSLD